MKLWPGLGRKDGHGEPVDVVEALAPASPGTLDLEETSSIQIRTAVVVQEDTMKHFNEYVIFPHGKRVITTKKKARRILQGIQKRPNRGISHDLKQ